MGVHIHTTQRLVKLQQEVEEIKSETQESDGLKRMWESLATRAQHIPNVRSIITPCTTTT